MLTHWGRVTHICVGKLIIIGSDNGLSPGRRPVIIHYLNQYWNIVNSNLREKRHWQLKPISCIFIQENAFENVYEMADICLGLNVLIGIDFHYPDMESHLQYIYCAVIGQ